MSRRKIFSIALALGCTGLFLWLAVRNVEFAQLGRVLAAVRWRWLPGMVFITMFVDIGVRALRWRILLSQAAPAPVGKLFRLSAIGLAVNNVLFARLGELLRAVLAARQLGLPLATTLASVAVERTLDVAALLSIFVTAAYLRAGLVGAPLRRSGAVVLACVLAVLALLVMAERVLEPGGFVERRLRSWPKLHEMVEHLVQGAAVLRRPRAMIPVAALSLGLWAVDTVGLWLGARALGLQAFIDYPGAMLVLSWSGAGSALPAAPGGIGTVEAMVKSIVVSMGASAPQALAYAVFIHMSGYILVTVMGLAFLYREGLSLGDVRESLGKERI